MQEPLRKPPAARSNHDHQDVMLMGDLSKRVGRFISRSFICPLHSCPRKQPFCVLSLLLHRPLSGHLVVGGIRIDRIVLKVDYVQHHQTRPKSTGEIGGDDHRTVACRMLVISHQQAVRTTEMLELNSGI